MSLFSKLKTNSTLFLLAGLIMILVSLQSWIIYSNYLSEKELLVRNLNESMLAAIESFKNFDSNALSIAKAINSKSDESPVTHPGEVENLIVNPDFELADSSFSTDYSKRSKALGAQLAGSNGWYITGVTSEFNKGTWQAKGYGGSGNLVAFDGATAQEKLVWSQTVKVQPGQSYFFGFQCASLAVTDKSKSNLWQRAFLRVKINHKIVGYILAPDEIFKWTPFETNWNSNGDTSLTIEITNLNCGSRYNDFALDHFELKSLQNIKTINSPTFRVWNTAGEKLNNILPEKMDVLNELIIEEFSFRGVKSPFGVVTIPSADFLQVEKENIPLYHSTSRRYFDTYFEQDNVINSTYYILDSDTQVRCQLKKVENYLLSKLSGQLLLLGLSLVLSIFSIWLMNRFLMKRIQLTRLRYDITSNITHELKTPVATILAAIEALQNFGAINEKEKAERYLEITRLQANRLNELIEKALSISAVEEEGFALSFTETDLSKLLKDFVGSQEYVNQKQVQLTLKMPAEPVRLSLDFFHVNNILNTIVDNSIKYADKQAVINIQLKVDGNDVTISVKDNGPGIALRFHKLVFEKYFRVPTNDKYVVKGHGLGLHYVKIIMKLHKGTVRIISDGKTGTEVLLKFSHKLNQ